ncbi:MAG: translation initiation factor IF-2 N-terminal domain-containing protein, partial [Acidobacteria bacterium]|nr:translation initiation factor IF-2 N-terminal domain-containing protein [Acidobacteriota bacterium]
MSVRIYELAREFDMSNKDVVAACREAGLDVKSHSSTVEGYEADMIRRRLAADVGEDETEAPPAAAAPPPAPEPPKEPELSPDEQLAQARTRVISLPTRGAFRPKAEGVKLPGRHRPPARAGAAPVAEEEAAPAPVAAAPAEA